MRDLRTFRIFLSVLFMAGAVVWLFIGSGVTPMAAAAWRVQIIPSMIATTMGATGFWLVATFIFGRLYCSTVCPVGTLQDSATWLRRRLWRNPRLRRLRAAGHNRHLFAPFRYRQSGRWRLPILIAYLGCLLLGLIAAASSVEPWNIMRSASRLTNPESDARWLLLAADASLGALISLVVLIGIWVWALLSGRRFCSEICPVGTILGMVSRRPVYRIEIDPDRCINCMRCEEVCKVSGINVAERSVDNARCVRCFDCLKVCGNDAINLQNYRNRRQDPLMKKAMGD